MFKQTILGSAVATALLAGAAQAELVAVDVNAVGGTGIVAGFNVTDLFTQMQFYAETTTTQFDSDNSGTLNVGDSFADVGHAAITSFLPPGTYDAGIGNALPGGGGTWSEITVSWADLTGVLSGATGPNGFGGITFDQTYTAGTFNFYYDQPGDIDFGTSVGSGDDTGVTNGDLVLTLTLDPGTASTGTLVFDGSGNFLSGSSAINTVVTFAAPGFWLMNGTDDFADLLLNRQIILSFIDQNTDDVEQLPGTPGSGELFTILSNHDGSIVFTTVPVPGVLGLMGAGLLGLGWVNRRSRKHA